ncbi:MAG: GHKL domain-containing protein [Magnetococcales bacterium]|nr:GHKL domain-containing protein [Magnetococcales bacterium]
MTWRHSIKSQLLITLVTGLTVMFFLLWWAVNGSLRELTANYLEDRMEVEITAILAELTLDNEDTLILNSHTVDALFRFAFSGYYYQITLHGKNEPQILRSPSLGEFVLHLPALQVGEKIRFRGKGPKNENLLTLVKTISLREKKLTIAVAEDLTPLEKDLDAFLWIYGLISLLFLGLLSLLQIMAVHQAMLPLKKIRQDVLQLETGQINKLQDNVPDEMKEVVNQINLLLLRMEQRLVRSRSTITNLAHAMKTPLSTILQIVHNPPDQKSEVELRQEIKQLLSNLHEMIERELRRACLTDHPLPCRFFNPEQSIGILIRTLQNINFQKRVEIELNLVSGKSLPFDHEDMMELLGNLLDNAFKWANQKIRVSIEEINGQAIIQVEDDGPGVAPDETEFLTHRGVRLDETRPGHGLGLAIVRETVEHYSGSLSFHRSSILGGFQVEVMLPFPVVRQ